MSRRYREPITVRVLHGQPVAITWRHTHYRVRVIGRWRLRTVWWDATRATDRTYYRVQTRQHEIFEVYRDSATGAWVLDTARDPSGGSGGPAGA